MILNDKDWQLVFDTMSREFDRDYAQDAIVGLLDYLKRREEAELPAEIENPLALARTIINRQIRDEINAKNGVTEIQISVLKDREDQGFSIPEALYDLRDPFEIVAVRQELEIIKNEYPELLEEVLNQEESIYDRVPDGMKKSLFYERKSQAWRESRERRTV